MANIHEKLIPAIIPYEKYDYSKSKPVKFNGTICVNQLLQKPKLRDPLDLHLSQFSSPKEKITKKQFSSVKQEQQFRLNRENKLKVNEEISNYLENVQRKHLINKIPKKSEAEQIKDASKQIAEINNILEHRRKVKPKKKQSNHLFGENIKVRPRRSTTENSNHTCTKVFGKKPQDYNAIIEKFERQLRQQEEKMRSQNKFFFSTSDVQKQTSILKKSLNKSTKQNVQTTLDAISARLTKSRDTILYHQSQVPKPEKTLKTEIHKRPQYKYKSLKDMEIDVNKLKQFEEDVKARYKLANDAKETKVLYENEIFKKTNKPKHNECYSELNLTKEYIDKEKLSPRTAEIKSPKYKLIVPNDKAISPREDLKKTVIPQKNPQLKHFVAPSTPKESKTIGVGTNFGSETELQKSVMRSDYLKMEFKYNPDFQVSSGKSNQNSGRERVKKSAKEVGLVNWADKYKVPPLKKLPKELEYLMS